VGVEVTGLYLVDSARYITHQGLYYQSSLPQYDRNRANLVNYGTQIWKNSLYMSEGSFYIWSKVDNKIMFDLLNNDAEYKWLYDNNSTFHSILTKNLLLTGGHGKVVMNTGMDSLNIIQSDSDNRRFPKFKNNLDLGFSQY